MKKTIIFAAVLLSAAMAVPSFAPADSPLADKLPDDSCAYIGWAGRTPAFDGTLLGQMLDDPAMIGILDLLKQFALSQADGSADSEMGRIIGPAMELGCLALKHPMAACVFGLKAEDGAPPELSLAILADMGKNKDTFEKAVAKLLDSLGKDATFEKTEIAAVPCRVMKLDDKHEMTIASNDAIIFLSVGPLNTAEKLLQVKPQKSLATSPAFIEAMKPIALDNQQVAVYFNMETIFSVVKKAIGPPEPAVADAPKTEETATPANRPPEFAEILKALGVSKITTIAGAIQIADKSFITRVRIATPAPHEGLFMPLAGGVLAEPDLTCAPDDADFLLAFKLNPSAAFAEFRRVLRLLDARDDKELGHAIVELEGDLGISIEKDLLANLGDTWTLCEAQSQGGLLTGTVLTVQAKNIQKLQETQAKIEAYFKEKVFAPPTPPPDADPDYQRMIARRPRPSIKVVKYNQAEIHYLALADSMPVAPAWTIYRDRLMVALFPQVLMATIDNYGLKPLTKDPEFVKMRSKLSDKACMMMYGDSSRITKEIYPVLLVVGTMLSNMAPGSGNGVDIIYPPALSKLQKYASRDISCLWADDKAIIFENIANGGTSSAPTLGMAAGVAAVTALPSLGKARQNAKRAASMSNLSCIGKCCMLFSGEFNERYPVSLGVLAAYKNIISPKAFVSPFSGRMPPKVDKNGTMTGEVDYVYFVLDGRAAGDTIRAYERLENYNNTGTIVLKADCSVAWVDMATFKEMMEASAKDHERGKDKGYNPLTDDKK